MGDPNQLRPVKTNHNVFSVSLDIPITRIDLNESKRFSPEYESVIQQLRYYVDTNDETGLFTIYLWKISHRGTPSGAHLPSQQAGEPLVILLYFSARFFFAIPISRFPSFPPRGSAFRVSTGGHVPEVPE
ncbi:hypothetical protein TNCV_2871371 [Trichonephila clavipes]|nr:hypothetical protein TNCV_2871371 [Trichonephila clavipes]